MKCASADMLADIFTKVLDRKTFESIRLRIGIRDLGST